MTQKLVLRVEVGALGARQVKNIKGVAGQAQMFKAPVWVRVSILPWRGISLIFLPTHTHPHRRLIMLRLPNPPPHVLDLTRTERAHFNPQDSLLCHMNVRKFEFEFGPFCLTWRGHKVGCMATQSYLASC